MHSTGIKTCILLESIYTFSGINTRLFWNQCMHFTLLTMLLFINMLWYKERLVSLFTKYCKRSIYALVSSLKILTFSNFMTGISWVADELSYGEAG